MSSSLGVEPLRPAAPRVVIADDDAIFRSGVRAALQDAGIVVIAEADNGRDAIDLAVHFRPDVVLMDVVMVGMDGISATRAIAGRAPEVNVVLLTSSQDAELGMIGLRAGAAARPDHEDLPLSARDGVSDLGRPPGGESRRALLARSAGA